MQVTKTLGDHHFVVTYRSRLLRPLITQFGISYSFIDGGDVYSTKTALADARLLFSPYPTNKVFPYIYSGFGIAKNLAEEDSDFVPVVPIGIGLQAIISEQVLLTISGGYNLALSDELDGIARTDDLNRFTNKKHDGYFDIMIGFSYTMSKKSKKVEKKPETPKPIIIDKPLVDTDGDGINDETELTIYKTDPNKADTDNDGLNDNEEINKYSTDPLKKDTDSDGISDGDEVFKYKTDPLKKDSDEDGLIDGDEVFKYKTDPLKTDSDGDSLMDEEEIMTYATNPLKIDTDNGGMNDGAEIKTKRNPLDPSDDIFEMEKGTKIVLHGITFESNKSTIMPVSKTILIKVRESLIANPDVHILIIGHTDSQGNDKYNQDLSLQRAQAVKDWLVTNNIKSNRIKVEGKGETLPIATNDSSEGRSKNRRIEFLVE